MKKSLLIASLICLGVTLLCGMSSFKTPEEVKSPRSNASIVYDTIITPDGENSQCIKEVVVESDHIGCTCSLKVSKSPNKWYLYLWQNCGDIDVYAECCYIIHYTDPSRPQAIVRCTKKVANIGDHYVTEGNLSESECEPVSIKAWACFDNANQK